MKDEIKEVLDYLGNDNNYNCDCNDGSYYLELPYREAHELKDCITNLQEELEGIKDNFKIQLEYDEELENKITNLKEENERLKETIENLTTMTVNGDRTQIKNTAQYKLDIYKSRNEKAIEFNQIVLDSDYVYSQDEIAQKNINILNGGDEKC